MKEKLKIWKDKLFGLFEGESGKWKLAMAIISLVMVILAIVVFITAGVNDRLVPFSKAVTVVIGLLLLVSAAGIVLLTFVFGEETPNFFLYDGAIGRNVPVAKLNGELINARLEEYVSRIAENKGQLWLPEHIQQCDFGAEKQFAPAVAYKMLVDLAEIDSEGGWKCFCASSQSTVQWIADALLPFEPNMTKDLLAVKARFGNDPAKVRGFVMHNLKYLRARAVQYAVKSIGYFDNVSVQ